jgi:RHS repeat-associated protein
VVTYLYDGQNKRVKKHLQTGPDVVYIYDGWRCIEEREYISNAWKAKRQYVFGGRYLDEELLFDKDTDGDGNCTEGDGAGSKRYLYCANNNYNVMALTDATGAVAERYKYDPYGACTVTLDDSSGNPFRFQGKRLDAETGLYYFNNRYYRSDIGRFIQWDTIGHADGVNLYEFLGGRPNDMVDPAGLEGWKTQSGSGERVGADLIRDPEVSKVTMKYSYAFKWKCDDEFRTRATGETVTYSNLTPFLLDETSITIGVVNLSGGDKVVVNGDLVTPFRECPSGKGYKGKEILHFKWIKWASAGIEIGVKIQWGISFPIPGLKHITETTYQSWDVAYIIDCCCNSGKPNETIMLAQ